jgi:hypothetical protein
MIIAILGWGSLIWEPKELEFDRTIGWLENGPILPIEFARISNNKRLTLVITPEGTPVKTMYSISTNDRLDLAVTNLIKREGTIKRHIHSYSKTNGFSDDSFLYKGNIIDWINTTDYDCIIWTNLPENWKEKTDDRIEYLKGLSLDESLLAKEYICNTPVQTKTKYRTLIEEKLNWR